MTASHIVVWPACVSQVLYKLKYSSYFKFIGSEDLTAISFLPTCPKHVQKNRMSYWPTCHSDQHFHLTGMSSIDQHVLLTCMFLLTGMSYWTACPLTRPTITLHSRVGEKNNLVSSAFTVCSTVQCNSTSTVQYISMYCILYNVYMYSMYVCRCTYILCIAMPGHAPIVL